MANYLELEMQALLDLVVKHTSEYTKMWSSRSSTVEEITRCKENLKSIHSAIELKHDEEMGKMITILSKGDKTENTKWCYFCCLSILQQGIKIKKFPNMKMNSSILGVIIADLMLF